MMNVLWVKQRRTIITVKATDSRELIILTFIYLGDVYLNTLTRRSCQQFQTVGWFTEAFDSLVITFRVQILSLKRRFKT